MNEYVVKTTLVPIRNMKLLLYWRSISKASVGGIEDEEIIHTFSWYNDDDDDGGDYGDGGSGDYDFEDDGDGDDDGGV